MASVTIKIEMNNAAFADWSAGVEVSRILRNEVVKRVELFPDPREWATDSLRDVNGNKVGSIKVSGRRPRKP